MCQVILVVYMVDFGSYIRNKFDDKYIYIG